MSKIYSIQTLRTIAAVLVCFSHVHFSTKEYAQHYNLPVFHGLDGFESFFRSGVDIFFVVSGFIIYYITHNKTIDLDFSKKFIKKRAIRIYSMYWIVLTAFIFYIAFFSNGIPESQQGFFYILGNYMLIPGFRFIPICWTLAFEMFFYVSFYLALLINIKYKKDTIKSLVVIITSFYFITTLTYTGSDELTIYASPLVYEFLMGVYIGSLYFKKIFISQIQAYIALIVYALVVTYNLSLPPTHDFNLSYVFHWGLPSALLVYTLLSLENNGLNFDNILSKIGDTTYSLYLIHTVFMVFFVRMWIKLNLPDIFSPQIMGYALVLLTVIVGIILHHTIEKRLLVIFNSLFLKPNYLNHKIRT